MTIEAIFFKISNLLVEWSGQLIFLGSTGANIMSSTQQKSLAEDQRTPIVVPITSLSSRQRVWFFTIDEETPVATNHATVPLVSDE
ncbi:MAG: hypothetical protein ABW115_14350 [Candidatus Thiodiazotropha sp. 6PLUC6]